MTLIFVVVDDGWCLQAFKSKDAAQTHLNNLKKELGGTDDELPIEIQEVELED